MLCVVCCQIAQTPVRLQPEFSSADDALSGIISLTSGRVRCMKHCPRESCEPLKPGIQQPISLSILAWDIGRLPHTHRTNNLAVGTLQNLQRANASIPKSSYTRTQLSVRCCSQENHSYAETFHAAQVCTTTTQQPDIAPKTHEHSICSAPLEDGQA